MSEEREKEIREVLKLESLGTTTFFNPKTVRELLAEVDRLRAELDDSRQTRLAIKLTRTEEERDGLRAALKDIADHSQDSFATIKWTRYVNTVATQALAAWEEGR